MVIPQAQLRANAPRILLVDDHLQNLELLEAYLEEVHANIATAKDGLEALRAIQAAKPDLILLDVMMPRMSGFQLAQKLRGDPVTAGIPIIVVTALGEESDVERARELGITDFLTKPVNKVDLLNRVRAQLAAR
jgi:CheY-like chemotaxis protein